MKRTWLCLLAAVAGCWCGSAAPAPCADPNSDTYYFAVGTFEKKPDADAFTREWYSERLRTMNEPSLSCDDAGTSLTYRFTWLRSYRHQPMAIRIGNSPSGPYLHVVELNQANKPVRRPSRPLTHSEWIEARDKLKKLLARKPVPGEERPGSIEWLDHDGSAWITKDGRHMQGRDGEQWIFEGRSNGKHHVLDIWSPEGPAYEVGEHLLRMAGIDLASQE